MKCILCIHLIYISYLYVKQVCRYSSQVPFGSIVTLCPLRDKQKKVVTLNEK